MDWVCHLLFAYGTGRFARIDDIRVVMIACLFPDIDLLWHHRSFLHAPLILLIIAIAISIYRSHLFKPLLCGFWSHSALDIFLFDNTKETIKHSLERVISDETVVEHTNTMIVEHTGADGIMMLYPLSTRCYHILLDEKAYLLVALAIVTLAIVSLRAKK